MKFSKVLYRVLPNAVFSKLRRRYFLLRQKLYKPISEDAFLKILTQKLVIQKGDVVFVHSSTDFLNISFSPFRLLKILEEAVGQEGTLLFPAWHFIERAEAYLQKDLVFDVKRSPSVLGLLPNLALRRPERERSLHPTSSIVAIGRHAKELVLGHEACIYPCDEKSPFYKMIQFDAKIIGIGVNANFLSFVHCPEDIMKERFPMQTRTSEVFKSRLLLENGDIMEIETVAAHENIQKRNVPAFLRKNIPLRVFQPYRIKGSDFFVADSKALFDAIVSLAEKNITIYNS